jgi:uroporphyrinogen III methyltransferase / synthase
VSEQVAPLRGKRILVTRAAEQAPALSERLRALGGEPVEFPVLSIADPEDPGPLDTAIGRLESYRWLVLTSANGVERLIARLQTAGLGPESLRHLRVAAVGTATAEALQSHGVAVDVLPHRFRGASVPEAMASLLQKGDRVLMARAALADPAAAEGLRSLGAAVDDVPAYRTVPAGGDAERILSELAAGRIDYVTLTSGSAVTYLLAVLGGPGPLGGTRIACIGPETARAAVDSGLSVAIVAAEATAAGLAAALAADAESRR